MEREFNAYKLYRCMCPSNYNRFWDTARYFWKKSSFYHTPLHSTPPLEYRHPLWCGKTRMVSLPDGEKISEICLFVLTWSTNVTDGDCMTAKTALASHRAVKIHRQTTGSHNRPLPLPLIRHWKLTSMFAMFLLISPKLSISPYSTSFQAVSASVAWFCIAINF